MWSLSLDSGARSPDERAVALRGKGRRGRFGGIDSSFTIQTYRRSEWGVSSLTHVLFHNLIGDPLSSSSSDAASTCEELKVAAQRYADRAGLPLVTVESNFQFDFIHNTACRLGLENGRRRSMRWENFGTYLLSSACMQRTFSISGTTTEWILGVLLSCYLFDGRPSPLPCGYGGDAC